MTKKTSSSVISFEEFRERRFEARMRGDDLRCHERELWTNTRIHPNRDYRVGHADVGVD